MAVMLVVRMWELGAFNRAVEALVLVLLMLLQLGGLAVVLVVLEVLVLLGVWLEMGMMALRLM